MIRPMAVLGCSVLGTLVICGLFGGSFAFYASIVALLVFLTAIFFRRLPYRSYFAAVALSACIACVYFASYSAYAVTPLNVLNGKSAVVTATVKEELPAENGKVVYILKTKSVEMDGAPQSFRLRFTGKTLPDVTPGDTLQLNVHFYTLADRKSEGSRHFADRLYIGAYTLEDAQVLQRGTGSMWDSLLRLRKEIRFHIAETAPRDVAGLLVGMLLGDTSLMGKEQLKVFQSTGVAHLFAVSGLHVTLWSHCILFLLKMLRLNRILQYTGGILSVLFYMALTGFRFSVIRAGIMLILYFSSRLVRRDADALNSLGTAALFVCCTSPFVGYDAGVLLSFSATLGILVLGRYWNRKIKDMPMKRMFPFERTLIKGVLTSLSVTMSAIIFTFLPECVMSFEQASLVSPLTNLLTVVPATAFIVAGGLTALISAVPGLIWFADFCYAILQLVADYLIGVNKLLGGLPGVLVPIHLPEVFLWTGITCLLFIIAVIWHKKYRLTYRIASMISAILLVITILFTMIDRQIPKIIVCDVEEGTSVLVTQGGRGAMIGCGGKGNAYYGVNNQCIRNAVSSLDVVLLPRSTEWETNAFDALASEYPVSGVIYPQEKKELVIMDDGTIPILRQNSGKILLWDSVTIAYQNTCVLVSAGSLRALILTKPTIALEEIPVEWRDAPLMIAKEKPKYALEGCTPETLILSASNTTYQKAKPAVPANISLLCTADSGAISVLAEKEKYRIRSEF